MLRRLLLPLFATLLVLGSSGPAPAGDEPRRMGLRPTPPAEYLQYPVWSPPAAAPTLRDGARPGLGYRDEAVDLRPYMPPPGDQGAQGSCVGWAVAYGALSYHQAVRRGRPPRERRRQMSPAFLYNQINGGRDQGSLFPDALAVVRDIGGVSLADMPYDDADFLRQPSGDLLADAAGLKLYGYARLETGEDVRNALAMRLPVVIAMETSEKFLRRSKEWQVYRKADWTTALSQRRLNQPHGLHAVILVGYDDGRRAFLMQNSWGTDWGQGGYCWLSYDLFDSIHADDHHPIREAWILFSGRLVHPNAGRALGIPATIQGDLWVDTFAQSVEGEGWQWRVAITPGEQPITRVDWSWIGADEKMHYRDGGRGEADLVLRQHRREGGVVPVYADVAFADGGTQRVEARVFLAERMRPLRIRFRDRYWGREGGRPEWTWWAQLSGPEAELDSVEKVIWELGPGYQPSRVLQDRDATGAFSISGRSHQPTRLDAIVELMEDGRRKTQRVRCATAFFSAVEDRVRIATRQGENEDGPLLGLWIEGPLRELQHVVTVTWQVDGRTLQTVRPGRSPEDVSFPLDVPLRASPTHAITVRAVLEATDGRTRTVEGRHVPVGR